MIRLRWQRHARTATAAYRGRLADRLDRVSQDLQYASLRERAADELEVLDVLWEEKANDAAHALLAGSMGWIVDPPYCRCGAHTIDTPCYLPDVRDRMAEVGDAILPSAHVSLSERWSVKVPERPALAVVPEDGAA